MRIGGLGVKRGCRWGMGAEKMIKGGRVARGGRTPMAGGDERVWCCDMEERTNASQAVGGRRELRCRGEKRPHRGWEERRGGRWTREIRGDRSRAWVMFDTTIFIGEEADHGWISSRTSLVRLRSEGRQRYVLDLPYGSFKGVVHTKLVKARHFLFFRSLCYTGLSTNRSSKHELLSRSLFVISNALLARPLPSHHVAGVRWGRICMCAR